MGVTRCLKFDNNNCISAVSCSVFVFAVLNKQSNTQRSIDIYLQYARIGDVHVLQVNRPAAKCMNVLNFLWRNDCCEYNEYCFVRILYHRRAGDIQSQFIRIYEIHII